MATRNYSATAVQTTLTVPITSSSTTLTVGAATGYPTAPFIIVCDKDTSSEEVILVGGVTSTNFTSLTRGYDSTTAVAHSAGASVVHAFTALDAREANDHVNDSTPTGGSPVHGVTSDFVGIDDTQTLDSKTFQSATTTGAPLTVKAHSGQSDTILAIQDSGGTEVAGLTPDGRLATPGVDATNYSAFVAGSASTVPLTAQGAASQTAHLLDCKDSGGTAVAYVSAAGGVTASGNSSITTDSSGVSPLTLQGAAGQSVNLLSVNNSSATTVASFDKDGYLGCPVPYARVRRTSSLALTDSTTTTITWDFADTDPLSMVSGSSCIIPRTGTYIVGTHGGMAGTAGDYTRMFAVILLNGTAYLARHDLRGSSLTDPYWNVSTMWHFAASDYIQVVVLQSNAATASRNVAYGVYESPCFWISWVPGS